MPEATTFQPEGAGTGRRAVHTPPTPEAQREGAEWSSTSNPGVRGGGMASPGPGIGRAPLAANGNINSNTNGKDGDQRRTRPESRGGGGPTATSERERPERSRPPPAPRLLTNEEETVVEKQWGALFEREDRGGAPTLRLGQFLRGLAHHLVEDFEPRGSLVIGPKKMRRFYELMKVDKEMFPWRGMSLFAGIPAVANVNKLSSISKSPSCQSYTRIFRASTTSYPHLTIHTRRLTSRP
jgi:hypothetical protein